MITKATENQINYCIWRFSTIEERTLENFLKHRREDGWEQNTFLVLKDINHEREKPEIIALLKKISEDNLYRENYHCTVFIISSKNNIPAELENYITVFDVPFPSSSEIENIIKEFAIDLKINIDQEIINDIALSFKGLNEFQIKQILNLAYQSGGIIDSDDKELILREKEAKKLLREQKKQNQN